jgi:hypothetical protein
MQSSTAWRPIARVFLPFAAAQYATGVVLEHWSTEDGYRSVVAYQVAFGLNVALQIAALAWFALPWLQSVTLRIASIPSITPTGAFDAVEAGIFCGQADDEW